MPFPVAVYRSYRAHQTETGKGGLCSEAQKLIRRMGHEVIRINAGGRVGRVRLAPRGTYDLLVPGLCWIETKVGNRKLNAAQMGWAQRMRARGVLLYECWSLTQVRDAIYDAERVQMARIPNGTWVNP
jgi:hypothetical protein